MALRITDAIDMHCHFGPDAATKHSHSGGHTVTGIDAAREARDSGHKAIVLKSHSFASPQLAANIEQAVPGIKVFGGICTDYPSGGLNVEGVEFALMMGARIVWLPTVHSHQDWLNGKGEFMGTIGEGIKVIGDEGGKPTEAVRAIFDMVKQYDAILATGHTTAAEHYSVVREFAREGKILVTHAGEALAGPRLSPQQCRELADLGATIEITAQLCNSLFGHVGKDPQEVADMIAHIGHERCTLATDYGWTHEVPHPACGLNDFLEKLWNIGLTEAQLTRMVSTNPARLLGLS